MTDQANSFSPPDRVVIEISRNCNLDCIMCGFGGEKLRSDLFISRSLFSRILYEVAFHAKEIRLNGRGESALHPFFAEMIRETRLLDISLLSLFTNFSWKKDPLLETFVEHQVLLYLSIDSPVKIEFEAIRKNGSFDRFMNNLTQIRHIEPIPFFVFTIQNDNLHRIFDIAEFALEYEVGLIYNVVRVDDSSYKVDFIRKIEQSWNNIYSDLQKSKQLLEDHGLTVKIPDHIWGKKIDITDYSTSGVLDTCPNVTNEVFIAYDGSVFPCNMFNPYSYGHLMENQFSHIWGSTNHQQFLSNHKKHSYCANCEFICD